MLRLDPQRLRHEGDDVGLGDRLIVADGQRMVGVGLGPLRFRHEQMARHRAHRVEDARAADVTRRELILDHPRAIGASLTRAPRCGSAVPALHASAAIKSSPPQSSEEVLRAL